MRHRLLACTSACAIAAAVITAAGAAELQGNAALAYSALESQNHPGFGYVMVFVPSAYTPPAIVSFIRRPLASQDQAGFGYSIDFAGDRLPPVEIVAVH